MAQFVILSDKYHRADQTLVGQGLLNDRINTCRKVGAWDTDA